MLPLGHNGNTQSQVLKMPQWPCKVKGMVRWYSEIPHRNCHIKFWAGLKWRKGNT